MLLLDQVCLSGKNTLSSRKLIMIQSVTTLSCSEVKKKTERLRYWQGRLQERERDDLKHANLEFTAQYNHHVLFNI